MLTTYDRQTALYDEHRRWRGICWFLWFLKSIWKSSIAY